MKSNTFFQIMMVFIFSVTFFSCSKDDSIFIEKKTILKENLKKDEVFDKSKDIDEDDPIETDPIQTSKTAQDSVSGF